MVTGHRPERPEWSCAIDGEPWPCHAARVELAEEYVDNPTALTLYLASYLYDAVDDYAGTTDRAPPDLFERFLGWARPPVEPSAHGPARTRWPLQYRESLIMI